MNTSLIGTQWKVLYDLPYSDPIIFKFIDEVSVRTNSGTKFNWKYISNNKIEIYILDYVNLYGEIADGILRGGIAYSDYSGLEWKWTCERFIPNPKPIVSPIDKSDLVKGKWTIFNSLDLPDNEIIFNKDGNLSSSLYGIGTWSIKDYELVINTANNFIVYNFQILDNEWHGEARNEMGDKWESHFKHTFIVRQSSSQRQTVQQSDNDLYHLYNQRKRDSKAIAQYLKEIGITCFYHFTDRLNLNSIKANGGLFSWYYCVQNNISIAKPGGDQMSHGLDMYFRLHDYVRLSFCKNHPMIYICKKDGRISDPIVLEVSIDVAEIDATLFSDINAADKSHKIGNDISFLRKINSKLFSRNYLELSTIERKEYQAEILVKTWIPMKFIKQQ